MKRSQVSFARSISINPEDHFARAMEAEKQGKFREAARYYSECYKHRNAEMDLINSVQEGLSSRMQISEIYNLVGDKLRDTFNAQIVMISQYDPHGKRIFHHYAVEKGVHLHLTEWFPVDSSRARIVATGKPYIINSSEIDKLIESGAMFVVPGTLLPKTWLGVPLIIGNEVRGIVSLQNLDFENVYTRSDINLLTSLTNSMAKSLENARLFSETQRLLNLLEGEMEIARQTQKTILPDTLPYRKGYDFGSLILPARAVSGDFFDFIRLGKDRLCVVIGDVTDKGLPAALFMALTFSLIRAETKRERDALKVLQNVNRSLLSMNASGLFVTLSYCVLDYRTGSFRYYRAGHPKPVVIDADGKELKVEMEEGQPLGIFTNITIDIQECVIPPGGAVLLYSDGLNEAMNAKGLEFGSERVKQEFSKRRKEYAHDICRELRQVVEDHCEGQPNQDDFTAVVIKRETGGKVHDKKVTHVKNE